MYNTHAGKIGALPGLSMPKHCARGTSTARMCKHKHGKDRYIARAGHTKTLYKWYKQSTHCAMVQSQYVRASTSTGKIGTLPALSMPKHCASGTSTVRTCKHKHSCTLQHTHTRTHDEWYNARAAYADRRTHTYTHTIYTARTVEAEHSTAYTYAENKVHKAQYKFWPYTPPAR